VGALILLETEHAVARHCVELDPALAPRFSRRAADIKLIVQLSGARQYPYRENPSRGDLARRLADERRTATFAGLDDEQQLALCQGMVSWEPRAQSTPIELRERSLARAREQMRRSEELVASLNPGRRVRFVGSREPEPRIAHYLAAWRDHIEDFGTHHFGGIMREKQLYGRLVLTTFLLPDGSVEKVQVNRSSGRQEVDDLAKDLVLQAAPYPAFPDELIKDVDVLAITRTFTFTKDENASAH
jgi:TonB family protein